MTGYNPHDATVPARPPTAYEVFGLNPDCTDTDITETYQKLTSLLLKSPSAKSPEGEYLLAFIDYHYSLINTPSRRVAYATVLLCDHSAITAKLERLAILKSRYDRLHQKCQKLKSQRAPISITIITSLFGGFFRSLFTFATLAAVVVILLIFF